MKLQVIISVSIRRLIILYLPNLFYLSIVLWHCVTMHQFHLLTQGSTSWQIIAEQEARAFASGFSEIPDFCSCSISSRARHRGSSNFFLECSNIFIFACSYFRFLVEQFRRFLHVLFGIDDESHLRQ